MGNIIYFITFPESKQNRAECSQVFSPDKNEDKNVNFLVVIHSLSYILYMLPSAIMITDRNIRLLPLALWSVNPRFTLSTVFIFKYFINPSMEYLIPIWWPSVSKIVQKHNGTWFSHCSCHCKTVSNSVCLSEGATVTKGGGAYR